MQNQFSKVLASNLTSNTPAFSIFAQEQSSHPKQLSQSFPHFNLINTELNPIPPLTLKVQSLLSHDEGDDLHHPCEKQQKNLKQSCQGLIDGELNKQQSIVNNRVVKVGFRQNQRTAKELKVDSKQKIKGGIFASSGDCEHDLSQNSNELPLTSICRSKTIKCFNEWEDSDDVNDFLDRKKGILVARPFFRDRKQSLQASDEDVFIKQCIKCKQLVQRCSLLEETNKDLQFKLNQLKIHVNKRIKIQRQQYQSSTNSNDELSSVVSLQLLQSNTIQEQLFQHLSEAIKIINQYLKNNEIQDSFTEQQKQVLFSFSKTLNQLNKCLKYQDQPDKYGFLHQRYKYIIHKLKKYYTDKIHKMDIDFKNVMTNLIKKPVQTKNQNGEKQRSDLSSRKIGRSKTSLDKEQSAQSAYIQQLKQKIMALNSTLERDKIRSQSIQKYGKKLMQKYCMDIKRLTRQRDAYQLALSKTNQQFNNFMHLLVNNTLKFELSQSDLFKTISLRIYEISNSIPFEENDEQNLFVAQNEQQLLDMIERIRKFYYIIDEYNSKKSYEQLNYKRNITMFLKDLVESEKVSLRYLLELIKKYKQVDLEYIKSLIIGIRQKRTKQQDRKTSPGKRRYNRGNIDSISRVNFDLSDEADRE